jgi:hypothetical protein
MDFKRKNFYGLDLNWFAVDSDNCIAQFTSGLSVIPKVIFEDQQNYESVSTYFQNLPEHCPSLLSEFAASLQNKGVADFSIDLMEARKGIFIYGEETYSSVYHLHALPTKPIKLESLEGSFQKYLERCRIAKFSFLGSKEIDISKKFVCE